MTFGTKVTTITQDKIVPAVIDNYFGGNVLTMRMLKGQRAAHSWGKVGGTSLKIPIKYTASSSGGWYENWDTFKVNQTAVRTQAEFKMKQMYFSVPVSGAQLGVNKGEAQVLRLLTTEMDSVASDMLDTFGTGLYSDGTGTSNKQLTGLQAAVDDGNGVATYAGLARGTYTTWLSDLDSSSNTITRAELAASHNAAKQINATPTIGVTTETIWNTIEGLAVGTVSFNNPIGTGGLAKEYGTMTRAGVRRGQAGELGFTTLFFRGVPIVADPKCTSGYFYFLDENHIGLGRWPYPDSMGYVTKSNYHGFAWTGLKVPTNQDATVGQFLFYGDLITDSCRAHSYMTGKS